MSPEHHQGSWFELQAWLHSRPPVRAVVCDIYGTLLEVTPPSGNVSDLLTHWCEQPGNTPLELLQSRLTELVVAEHARSSASFPEVDWVGLFGQCFPAVRSRALLARLARHHARQQRTCHLHAGVAEFLTSCESCAFPLGLCSNAQAYTLMELRLALRAADLSLANFDLDRSFFSYQQGIGKPHPEIFPRLTERWEFPAMSLLMVGDRFDNDIHPAMQAGWNTWQVML
jgi:FMN phosphatase YigB (HAD superfamily)